MGACMRAKQRRSEREEEESKQKETRRRPTMSSRGHKQRQRPFSHAVAPLVTDLVTEERLPETFKRRREPEIERMLPPMQVKRLLDDAQPVYDPSSTFAIPRFSPSRSRHAWHSGCEERWWHRWHFSARSKQTPSALPLFELSRSKGKGESEARRTLNRTRSRYARFARSHAPLPSWCSVTWNGTDGRERVGVAPSPTAAEGEGGGHGFAGVDLRGRGEEKGGGRWRGRCTREGGKGERDG